MATGMPSGGPSPGVAFRPPHDESSERQRGEEEGETERNTPRENRKMGEWCRRPDMGNAFEVERTSVG